MTGCGLKRGVVTGATDGDGVDVIEKPFNEQNLFATIFTALGLQVGDIVKEGLQYDRSTDRCCDIISRSEFEDRIAARAAPDRDEAAANEQKHNAAQYASAKGHETTSGGGKICFKYSSDDKKASERLM